MKQRTKNISGSVLKDALNVVGGMYSLNAKTSIGYAFIRNATGKEVEQGEFIFDCEIDEVNSKHFDGYIDFKNKTCQDLETKQIIQL